MKKVTLETSVINGRFNRNRNLVLKTINSFEGKNLILTFEKPTKKRTLEQNNFYWGVFIPIAKQAFFDNWGEVWSNKDLHSYFLDKCPIYREVVNLKTGEINSIKKSSSEMTTIEMNRYWELCGAYLSLNFDVYVPEPNENLTLEL